MGQFANKFPRTIHQVWMGPKRIPPEMRVLMGTWRKANPSYNYILWTDKELAGLDMTLRKYFEEATNYGRKSDIARFEILQKYGGLYVDTDMECVKPFEPLYEAVGDKEVFVGYEGMTVQFQHSICTALMASLPNSKLLETIIKECPASIEESHKQTHLDAVEINSYGAGPSFLTRMVWKCHFSVKVFEW